MQVYRLSLGILFFLFSTLGLMTVGGVALIWLQAATGLPALCFPVILAWLGLLAWVRCMSAAGREWRKNNSAGDTE